MALYIVVRENPYFKRFSYVEDLDEDIGEPMVQPVQLVAEYGRHIPMYNYGFAIPRKKVRKSLLRVQKLGVDMEGLKG